MKSRSRKRGRMERIRVLVCPDSFKGSLSAAEAAAAIARGVRRAWPEARVETVPLADGGEGTLDALSRTGGARVRCRVTGPLGRLVPASYMVNRSREAVIEMAQAAGLTLVPRARRDPVRATTLGVGQLVRSAIARGARRIVVTLGGSATVDGGSGMARALGARLLDRNGRDIPPGGGGLGRLARIDTGDLLSPRGLTVVGATDVDNPLLGARGAARVFGPQKGATKPQVALLERNLSHFARVCRRDLGIDPARIPGAGAAGGLGAGLAVFLRARLESGARWLFRIMRVEHRMRRSDLVITGEGSLDSQTAMGKLVSRVARSARRHGIPVIVFAGRVRLPARARKKLGLSGAWAIADEKLSDRECFRRAGELLERRVRGVFKSFDEGRMSF